MLESRADKQRLERISIIIDSTQKMLGNLQTGLMAGEPSRDLGKLATEAAIAITIVETLLTPSAPRG